jgi:hypothetical protein
MLSIDDVRKILGKEAEGLSDEELTRIRDEYHILAEIVLDQWEIEKNKPSSEEKDTGETIT